MSTQDNQQSIRRLVSVRGRVQGVGFRMAAAQEAERLGVAGTVRNLFDGAVEADLEGPAEAVEAMCSWLEHGPPSAQVDDVKVERKEPRGASGFHVAG